MAARVPRPATVARAKVFRVSAAAPLPLRRPLALKPTKNRSSLEGVGLSVSMHPAAWARIARLGSTAHELRRIDGAKGIFALFDEAMSPAVARWGEDAGWTVPSEQWLSAYYDSEDDEVRWMVFDTEAEARADAADREDDYDPEDLGDVEQVRRISAVAATPKLEARLRRWFKGMSPGRPVDRSDAAVELFNLYVAHHWPELDGVWWDEDLDPAALSAPRGVILPHALERWQAVRTFELTPEDEDW